MIENPKWKGDLNCPDYITALNDRPPFRYKCTGSELTDEGAALLEEELMKQSLKKFVARN